jgi:uncharacterized membrane protein YbhN (UPF0104 family)
LPKGLRDVKARTVVLRALAVVVVVFAAIYLWKQWQSASREQLRVALDIPWLALASAIVLATYALLIETWRRVLGVYGSPVSFVDASHVWFVSNLGKYVPGKIWQVTAMTAMMTRLGARIVDAGSAAAVITVVNVLAGFAIVLAAGSGLLRTLGPNYERATILATLILVVALVAAPWTVRLVSRIASRALGRPLTLVVPGKATWISLAGCLASWDAYGLAFQFFVRALVGHADGPWPAYLTAYTLSYLVGYLTLFAPGGIGAREVVLASALQALHLTTAPEAALITVASRLWLTVLEILPGVLFLPRRLSPAEAESRSVPETPPAPR